MNLDELIDRRAFAIRWEIGGMAWRAAKELGCEEEYLTLSIFDAMCERIRQLLADNASFVRRRL